MFIMEIEHEGAMYDVNIMPKDYDDLQNNCQ